MLITCFQCRQQLDVPKDCAGKRVRCPHCQYVIVAPAAPKAAEAVGVEATIPVTALPSMDLDVGHEQPVETKVAPMPLPPIPVAPIPVAEPEKPKAKPKYDDELPPLPAIDRPTRRRTTMTPLKKPGAPWGKILGIGAIILLVLIGVIVGVVSSRSNRPNNFAIKAPPMMQPNVQMMNPNMMIPPQMNMPMLPWIDFVSNEARFKAKFPMNPMQLVQEINRIPMTSFQAQWNDWGFTIAHRTLPAKEFQQVPLVNRFAEIRQHFEQLQRANNNGAEQWIQLAGGHQGCEWSMFLPMPENRWMFLRTYFVLDGNRYHHYVLTAKGPRNNPNVFRHNADINTFFASFQAPFGVPIPGTGSGQPFIEQRDDLNFLNNPGRRDNEFTALALHPNKPVAAVGTVDGNLTIVSGEQKSSMPTRDGKPVRQLATSPDGQWLAVAEEKEIVFWRDWDNPDAKHHRTAVPGERCAFSKNQRLLVSTKTDIKEFDCQNQANLTATLPIPDFSIDGFALSSDQQTLAVFGEQAIELWNWPQKRRLGRIDAHEAPITTVAFSPDGKTLVSAGVDRWIRAWNVDTREERMAARQHAWTVWSLAFTPDGKYLASGGLDGMALLWEVQPAELRLVWAEGHQYPVRAVAFDKAGKHLYLTCKHTPANQPVTGRKWDRQLRKIAWTDIKRDAAEASRVVAQRAGLRLPGSGGARGALQISPDAKTIVTVDDPNADLVVTTRRVWDAATARLRYSFPAKPGGYFTPGGEWFLFQSPGGALQLLDMQTLRVRNESMPLVGTAFPQIAFTPNGKSVWIEQNDQFFHYQLPEFKSLQPPIKLKDANQRVTVYPSLDRKSFLVEAMPQTGLQRKRTWHASADGKQIPISKVAAPGAGSDVIRLQRDLNGFVQLEDIVNGTSLNIGQQRLPFLPGAVTRDQRFGVTAETRVGQAVHINLWDLQERRPLLTLPEFGASVTMGLRFTDDGKHLAVMTGGGWTRILPTDWLLERQGHLACNPNDVAGP